MRLFRWVLFVYASLLVAIVGTMLIGRAKPDPISELFLDPNGIPCTRPCLLGITPGKTTFIDAIAILKTHPLTRHLRMFNFSATYPTQDSPFYKNRAFSIDDTVFFAGESGQIVKVEIQKAYEDISNPTATIMAVTLSSLIDPAAPPLPDVDPILAQLWREATFEQVIASIGAPENLSFPDIGPHYVWSGATYFETFYHDNRLVFTYSSADGAPYFGHNAFGSVSVYNNTDGSYRFNTGYQGRVGATLPWLGLASPQKYWSWLDTHTTSCINAQCIP